MTSSLKNLTINDTGYIQLPNGNTAQRPGTITTNIVQFTTGGATVLAGSATTTATSITIPAGVTSIDVLVVGGGGSGGGGNGAGGGGGAGGVVYRTGYTVVGGNTYNLTVGAGGASVTASTLGNNGSNSTFDTLIAYGGGGGGCWNGQAAKSGGSGGGGGAGTAGTVTGAAPVFGQGNYGGAGLSYSSGVYMGGGGGGAGGPGGTYSSPYNGNGGDGVVLSISGTPTWYAGGGGAGSENGVPGLGGMGGGGRGGTPQSGTSTANGGAIGNWNGQAGTANTGSGGGAGGAYNTSPGLNSGAGGSGVVIVRYYTSTNALGTMRFNTTTQKTEVFNGTGWVNYTSNLAVTYNDAPAGNSVVSYYNSYKIHTYATVGTTTFTPTTSGVVEVLVVAGGGGGGGNPIAGAGMAGGGAGGVLYSSAYPVVAGTNYTVTVGDGGAGGADDDYRPGANGVSSVFGENIITNGTFTSNTTGWTANTTLGTGTTFTASGGVMSVSRGVGLGIGYGEPYQVLTVEANKQYVIVVDVGNTQMSLNVTSALGGGTTYYAANLPVGRSVVYFTPTSTTAYFLFICDSAGTTSTVDNVSVSKVETSLVAIGGGGGGGYRSGSSPNTTAGNGGSGGGGGDVEPGLAYPNGNPPGMGTPGQGNRGGYALYNGSNWASAGGGGAWRPGGDAVNVTSPGNGGLGNESYITGTSNWFGGGGGGAYYATSGTNAIPSGGGTISNGGGGRGWIGHGEPGCFNTGGGGGGGGTQGTTSGRGGKGGSGVVIVRYLAYQPLISNVFYTAGTWTCPPGVTTVEVLAVGGGGAGGSNGSGNNIAGGGGGGGGVVYNNSVQVSPGTTYSISVGAGGVASRTSGPINGGNSAFGSVITAYGGGGGMGWNGSAYYAAGSGNGTVGSGGGGGYQQTSGGTATTGQGNNGGTGSSDSTTYGYPGGGGGGAGTAGGNYNDLSTTLGRTAAGNGGQGVLTGVAGFPLYVGAGGGGGTGFQNTTHQQGWGAVGFNGQGGGNGSSYGDGAVATGYGNGGGGAGNNAGSPYSNSIGGNGTAGLVAIRYRPAPTTSIQPAGWRLPNTYFIKGALLNNNLIWNKDQPSGPGYANVAWNQTFTGDFCLVASYQHNYIGVGFMYGANVALTDFTGYSSDVTGPYAGGQTVCGFPNGYSGTFFGQYHAPLIAGGASTQTTLYYFKWQRTGNVLTLQYATASTGPWTNFNTNYTTTCTTGDKVICVIGAAASTQVQPLTFVSVSGY